MVDGQRIPSCPVDRGVSVGVKFCTRAVGCSSMGWSRGCGAILEWLLDCPGWWIESGFKLAVVEIHDAGLDSAANAARRHVGGTNSQFGYQWARGNDAGVGRGGRYLGHAVGVGTSVHESPDAEPVPEHGDV